MEVKMNQAEILAKIKEARILLTPYGLLEDEKDAIEVANLCLEANEETLISKEIMILHRLFCRPPSLLTRNK